MTGCEIEIARSSSVLKDSNKKKSLSSGRDGIGVGFARRELHASNNYEEQEQKENVYGDDQQMSNSTFVSTSSTQDMKIEFSNAISEENRFHESPRQNSLVKNFQHIADLYLGGIWNRMEAQLREREGDGYEYDVAMKNGCLLLQLPDGGKLRVCKMPGEERLMVQTTLQEISCSASDDPDPRVINAFSLDEAEGDFVDTKCQKLHSFLEEQLSHHLNVELDLEPGPHSKCRKQ